MFVPIGKTRECITLQKLGSWKVGRIANIILAQYKSAITPFLKGLVIRFSSGKVTS